MEKCTKPNCIKHCHEVVRYHNATSYWHIDVHKQDGLVTAREFKVREDGDKNIAEIYGLDYLI